MDRKLDWKKKFYREDQFDNDSVFRDLIGQALQPGQRVLDAGAGAGNLFAYDFKTRVAEMAGIDLDPRVKTNPQLHRGVCADLTNMPFENDYFDVIFSRYVLEHIADPVRFLAEIHRVLKPGGMFLFLTPNKWHYVCLGARFTPQAVHTWFNRLRGRDASDTFPTYYRMNSRAALRRLFARSGFAEQRIIMRECCPNYLLMSHALFLLGVAYERLVNTCDCLAGFRVNILAQFRKR